MMNLFLTASFLGFVLMSVIVSGRLLSVWYRTRQRPELLLGLSSLILGGIGYPVGAVLSADGVELSSFARSGLCIGANVACHLAYALVLAFTLDVFRPDAGWARAMRWPIWAIQAAAIWMFGVEIIRAEGHSADVLTWVSCLNMIAPIWIFGWTALEAFQAYRMAIRRAALGIGSPVVANRLLMWAGFAGTLAVGMTQSLVCNLLAVPYMQIAWTQASMSVLGLTESTFLVLAFFPPAGYQAWLNRRATIDDAA